MPIDLLNHLRVSNLLRLLFIFLFYCFSAVSFAQTASLPTTSVVETAKTQIFSKTDSFCGNTFFKRLSIQGMSTLGYRMVPAPNETFFFSASVGNRTLIAHTNKDLEPLWVKSVDMAPGPDANLLDLRLDAGGQLIGVGNTSTNPVQCFAFKMNAASGQLIWRSILNNPTNCYFTRILEKTSGENYFLLGQTDDAVSTSNGCDALLMEIDRNTGALLWNRQYTLGDCEIFDEVFLKNDRIYASGRFALAPGGHDHYRAALTALDTAGNVLWSRCYLRSASQKAHLFSNALQPDGDSIVVFGWGNDHVVSLTETTLQLMKTDSTGALAWAKQYDIAGGNEERSYRLINLPDGYLLAGWFRRPTTDSRDIYIIKTDKGGNLLWARSYGANGEDNFRDIVLVANTLYLIGSRQNAQIFDILVGKLDLNGNVEGQCSFVKDLVVTVSDYADPSDDLQPLAPIDVPNNYTTTTLPAPATETIATEVICQKICDNSCDKPDASVTIDSIVCGGGITAIWLRIYNTGFSTYPANSFLSFYAADPTASAAQLLRTILIPFGVDTGTSLSVFIGDAHTFLPAQTNFTLYAVVNDNGMLTTPFSFGSFPKTGVEECEYANNLDFHPVAAQGSPALTLGADATLCTGENLVLQADPGFYQYQWQDGSGNAAFTAMASGVYWVQATDGCGYQQTDTVVVTVLPPYQLTEFVEFCPGDSVLVGGVYYTQPDTVVSTIPGTGNDCDTVVTYTLLYYHNSVVDIQCPADVSVEVASGVTFALVNYNLPSAITDCPCSLATPALLQGLASGSAFPLGATQVCYEATDACGGTNSCCFAVTVQAAPPEDACDVKITPCVKFEILGIFQNPAKQRTYRMRVTNSCANKLIYTTFQLPGGVVADAPANNTVYTAPSGRQYEVRNPNFAPAWSVRFKAVGDGIADGQSDVFEYTLPPQSEPLYIHATAKLFPQVYAETHLNVFDCPVQQTSSRPGAAQERQYATLPDKMTIFPNPATDVLTVRLPDWVNLHIQLRVTDAFGRLLYEQASSLKTDVTTLELPAGWPAGVYYLQAVNETGERQTGRFVRAERR